MDFDVPSTWSRNWEDEVFEEEEDHSPVYDPIFVWGTNASKSLKPSSQKEEFTFSQGTLEVDVLVIGFAGAGATFLQALFQGLPRLGSIVLPEVSLKGTTLAGSSNDQTCDISFDEKRSIATVACRYDVSADRSKAWAQSLLTHVKCTRIIVLDRLLNFKYQGPSANSYPPHLRKLESATQRQNNLQECPHLEVPNMIDGPAAAILTWAETRKIACSLYLSLEESGHPAIETLEAFESAVRSHRLEIPNDLKAQLSNSRYTRHMGNALFA
eukprot:TRINITY_DN10825_c0_g1_i1.p1 TRINITY_DN10825_c0_g1~~TRINITY_DN10825_c0_g1_i1.p1  ORF type:complete len:270 (-),score=70.54 TRINITY_DN10825_c0_g1_i1:14-823(-)